MVDSVKSIPTDPLGKPVVWSWVDEGGFRQTAVKAGVKHGHLRHGTKCARDDFNAFQLGAVMERRKCCHARDRSLQPHRDEGWLLVFASAVYNTVAHDVDCRSITNDPPLTTPQVAQQLVGRLAARLQRELLLEYRALGGRNPQFRLVTVPFNLALPAGFGGSLDRKSTRLNSSHGYISYAVFCLKKKKK